MANNREAFHIEESQDTIDRLIDCDPWLEQFQETYIQEFRK